MSLPSFWHFTSISSVSLSSLVHPVPVLLRKILRTRLLVPMVRLAPRMTMVHLPFASNASSSRYLCPVLPADPIDSLWLRLTTGSSFNGARTQPDQQVLA